MNSILLLRRCVRSSHRYLWRCYTRITWLAKQFAQLRQWVYYMYIHDLRDHLVYWWLNGSQLTSHRITALTIELRYISTPLNSNQPSSAQLKVVHTKKCFWIKHTFTMKNDHCWRRDNKKHSKKKTELLWTMSLNQRTVTIELFSVNFELHMKKKK